MQEILSFWEYGVGIVLIVLMLWRVTSSDNRAKRKYERELAQRANHENDCKTLEEWVGWDGLHSTKNP